MSETTIYMRHRVDGASADLIIPVHLLVNVSDEIVARNVATNARRPGPSAFGRVPRVKTTPAHDRVAVMCGSGPSMADHVEHVRDWQAVGADVFALNGNAAFLAKHGITPDYQVLVDARERTAELIGPAKDHLIASQCDPACFDKLPHAIMWHFINGELDKQLPEDEEAHAQIGGAGSVGNCALALAWAMGYRHFEVYGYDSSHRHNASHAFHQPLNDFEPWGRFKFAGKEYICSYTMRSQASRFQVIGRELLRQGCTLNVHGDGLLQDMWRTPISELSEREKYERMWDEPAYRDYSPGEESAVVCAAIMNPKGTLIDFGCGTGRGGLALSNLTKCEVTLIDFAANCRDEITHHLPFFQWDLCKPCPARADYGYCCDVMEHVPPIDVANVINTVMGSASTVFFQISTVADQMGDLIAQSLHLTVRPHEWWREMFERLGYRVTWDEQLDIASRFIVKKDS